METLTHTIVEKGIDTAREKEGQTVEGFTDAVKKDVQKQTDELTEKYGDAAKDIARDALEGTETYVQTKKRILSSEFVVDFDAADKGAAAYVNMDGKKGAVSGDALSIDADEGYWMRVMAHEAVHLNDQASTFNRSELLYLDDAQKVQSIEVKDTMTEGQASMKNDVADLTDDYRRYRTEWEAFTADVGRERMTGAMERGDMQAVQNDIIEKAVENALKNDGNPREDVPKKLILEYTGHKKEVVGLAEAARKAA